jgi:carbon-monoxide dehydrogenase medium subunit
VKPAAFDFARAASLAEAARLLAGSGGAARLVAGAQSLGPMLNLRLVQPALLIDITAIPQMTAVERDADATLLGACVTSADVEDGRAAVPGCAMLAAVAGGIAYRAVRNRGTIGGSLCHADPAADWVSVLTALGAECVISDGGGTRRMPVERFVTGAFEVALEAGEVLRAVRIPHASPGARWGYYKICRKAGEFALAIGAVLIDADRDVFRAVLGAFEQRPVVLADMRDLFRGAAGAGEALTLDERAAHALLEQHGQTDPIARRLHLTALARAAHMAVAS